MKNMETCTSGLFARSYRYSQNRNPAFTLAEVLVTLGIVGVVASMTLPSVIAHWRHKVLEAQFKKSVSIISQILLQTKEDIGVDKLAKYCTAYSTSYYNSKECAHYMYQNMLKMKHNRSPVYRDRGFMANVRDRTGDKIKTYSGKPVGTYSALNSIYYPLLYTNLMADGSYLNYHINEHLFIVVVDLNGKKGPNQLGHDIFVFVVNKETDILTFWGIPQVYTDEEL